MTCPNLVYFLLWVLAKRWLRVVEILPFLVFPTYIIFWSFVGNTVESPPTTLLGERINYFHNLTSLLFLSPNYLTSTTVRILSLLSQETYL